MLIRKKGKQVASPEVYGKNLRELVRRLRQTGAALVFATTTPVPPGTLGRIAGDERPYNEVAKTVMAELNVPVDDLGGYVESQQEKAAAASGQRGAVGRQTRCEAVASGRSNCPLTCTSRRKGYDQQVVGPGVISNILKVLPPVKAMSAHGVCAAERKGEGEGEREE